MLHMPLAQRLLGANVTARNTIAGCAVIGAAVEAGQDHGRAERQDDRPARRHAVENATNAATVVRWDG